MAPKRLTKKEQLLLQKILQELSPKDRNEVLRIIESQQGGGYNEIMEAIGKYLGKVLKKLILPSRLQ